MGKIANPSDIIDELVQRIVDQVHPRRIILFGSAARGQMDADSDLDVLIVMPDGTHRRKTAQQIYRQLWGLGVGQRHRGRYRKRYCDIRHQSLHGDKVCSGRG